MRNKTKMERKVDKQLCMLRRKSGEAHAQYMLPTCLAVAIRRCDSSCSKEYIEFLMEMTKQLMRVRGFYRDKREEKIATQTFAEAQRMYVDIGKKGGS